MNAYSKGDEEPLIKLLALELSHVSALFVNLR
jgi:hypothetical protein